MRPEPGGNLRGPKRHRLTARIRARLERRDDGGMTLVEVLVSVVLVAVVLLPFAKTFYGTLNASSANGSRQNAAVLATSVISGLQSAAYGDVGFECSTLSSYSSALNATSVGSCSSSNSAYYWDSDSDGDTFSSSSPADSDSDSADEQLVAVGTQPTFQLGSTSTTFEPVMTDVKAGGTVYSVVTHISYSPSVVQSCTAGTSTEVQQAYKEVYVEVEWSNASIGHEHLTEEGIIYPGGQNPYRGPSYDATTADQLQTWADGAAVAAVPTKQAGEVTVTWNVANMPEGGCYAVGWSDSNGVNHTSGMLSPGDYTVSDKGVASYIVSGLLQGGTQQAYVFYVTGFSADGVEQAETTDTPTTDAPQGPIISSLSPTYGMAGKTVTLTGSGFPSGSTMNVYFCPNSGGSSNCTSPWSSSANCPSSDTALCVSATCSSATSCTATVPPSPNLGIGAFYVVAETQNSSSMWITSPPTSAAEFTYQPSVSVIEPTSGAPDSSVTVSGTNLFQNNTEFLFGSSQVTPTSCQSDGSSCIVTVPSLPTGSVAVSAVDGSAQSTNSASFQVT